MSQPHIYSRGKISLGCYQNDAGTEEVGPRSEWVSTPASQAGTFTCQDTLWLVKCRVLGQWCKPSSDPSRFCPPKAANDVPSSPDLGSDDHINAILAGGSPALFVSCPMRFGRPKGKCRSVCLHGVYQYVKDLPYAINSSAGW